MKFVKIALILTVIFGVQGFSRANSAECPSGQELVSGPGGNTACMSPCPEGTTRVFSPGGVSSCVSGAPGSKVVNPGPIGKGTLGTSGKSKKTAAKQSGADACKTRALAEAAAMESEIEKSCEKMHLPADKCETRMKRGQTSLEMRYKECLEGSKNSGGGCNPNGCGGFYGNANPDGSCPTNSACNNYVNDGCGCCVPQCGLGSGQNPNIGSNTPSQGSQQMAAFQQQAAVYCDQKHPGAKNSSSHAVKSLYTSCVTQKVNELLGN